jgi:hypothetical protein
MADDAFALSPISARAVHPSEEDYDAISHAFLETARGRWFLGEFAKRNRNADTRMVLDAVARIEQILADQKQPLPDNRLPEALAEIRSAVDEARAAAAAALGSLAIGQRLAPVRKGARVIREISWRWREIGADARICDLIDSQLAAIEAGCEHVASVDTNGALSAAFDLITQRITKNGEDDKAAPKAAETVEALVASPSAAQSEAMPTVAKAEAGSGTNDGKAGSSIAGLPVEPGVVATVEAAEVTAEAADQSDAAADATVEVAELISEAADAQDEAILDLVALEMAAPAPPDLDDCSGHASDEIRSAASPLGDPIMVAPKPEPTIAPAQPPAVQQSLQPSPQPSHEASLGSSLIASGIVRRPLASQPDPLAPIRRMSQAEKIAFFS